MPPSKPVAASASAGSPQCGSEDAVGDWESESASYGRAEHLFVLADSESEEELHHKPQAPPLTCLQVFVNSRAFETFFSAIIVLNLVAMVIQADYPDDRWPRDCHHKCYRIWHFVNLIFLSLFVAEIGLRILAFGCGHFFCTSADRPWNVFDFVIVLLGVLDVLARLLRLGHRGGRFIAISRVLRILRVLRIVRLLKTFRQLRMLARGLVESVTVVFWIFFLIVFLIFIYAIFFTDLVNHQMEFHGDQEEKIRMYFGNIFLAMFTLFQFVTLDNWVDVDALLMSTMPWPGPIQLIVFSFIIIESFVILSLLTGVMADHMDQVRKDEEADTIKANRGSFDGTYETFKKLFTKPERGDVAFVTKREFFTIFADRTLAAQLNADDIELTGPEALELFDVFDKDCDGVLMWSEFKSGMEDFREGLTIRQVLELKSIFCRLEREVARSSGDQVPGDGYRKALPSEAAQQELVILEERLAGVDKRLAKFDTKVKETFSLYGARSTYKRKPSIRRRTGTDVNGSESGRSGGASLSAASPAGASPTEPVSPTAGGVAISRP